MLDEIIKNNSELLKHPAIIPIIKKIESFIPENVRDNFYRNLQTLKINFTKNNENSNYKMFYNEVEIMLNFDDDIKLAVDDDLKQKMINDMFEATLFHELLHMASTRVYKETNLIQSGFSAIIPDHDNKEKGKRINNYLNEGFTEMITQFFYPNAYMHSGYQDTVNVSQILTAICGLDSIKQLYFSNSLAINLKNYMASFTDSKNIDLLFSNIDILRTTKEKCYIIHDIINDSLLPILDGAIKSGIKTKAFKTKDEFNDYYQKYIDPYLNNLINMMNDHKNWQSDSIEAIENYKIKIDNLFELNSTKNTKMGYITLYSLLTIISAIFVGIGIASIIYFN